jgi:uncharacterized membrane protein
MPSQRGLRLLGHPVHPMLVHLPMGLLLTAPLWDLLGLALPASRTVAAAVGDWTLAVGCLGGLAAAVAGMIDFAALSAEHPAGRAANLHLYLVLGALGFFGASVLTRHGHPMAGASPGSLAVLLAVLGLDLGGCLLLVAGGFFGAEMVYRHGVGRESIATEPRPGGYHQTGT